MKAARALLLAVMMASAALALAKPSKAQAAIEPACAVPDELLEGDPVLAETAARLKGKQPLVIAAVGGSSTLGKAAGGGDAAYPHQLELALGKRYPGIVISVLNKGAAGEVAQQMLERFDRDLSDAHATLVLWEVGVADAVDETDRDEFADTLQQGIAWLREHAMEVMLIDMQYSPDTAAVINFQPYLDTLHEVASLSQTPVFRRYEIMKYWSDNDIFQFTDVPVGERRALASRVYDCLGERLADAIGYAAR